MSFLEWMTKYEPIWLAAAFIVSIGFEAYTAWMMKKEYDYDEAKDIEKKQKRTKTTKKTIDAKLIQKVVANLRKELSDASNENR